jgi:hypothetical protein
MALADGAQAVVAEMVQPWLASFQAMVQEVVQWVARVLALAAQAAQAAAVVMALLLAAQADRWRRHRLGA